MDFKARAQMWLDSPKVSDADKEIIRNSSDDKLRDMFGGDIAFGTAGLRGEMGPGTNRMNPLVVQKLLLEWQTSSSTTMEKKERSVA